MRKSITVCLLSAFILAAFAGVAMAQDISGSWTVALHGYNYFTDRSPSKVTIGQTETTMDIEQNGDRVTVTFGGFAGASSATIFKGAFGQNKLVATWWYQGYPYETKVITAFYSQQTGNISGTMLYPRAADKDGLVPGWVEVKFVAKRKLEPVVIPQQPVEPLKPVEPVKPQTIDPQVIKPVKPVIPGTLVAPVKEDCISFSYQSAEVKNINGRWKIVDGGMWLLDFGGNKAEADTALKVIKTYQLNQQCFVGRPDPSMRYWLANGQAPVGTLPGHDNIGFNPDNIEVKQINGRWKIVEGSHWILDFAASEDEARTAYSIIKKYDFNYICFVGRPDPSMVWFCKE